MTLAARTDANQKPLVAQMRALPGVSVAITSGVGDGFPDLVVGYDGKTFLLEVKDPAKPLSARKLTKDQEKWHGGWKGQVAVVMTFEDCVRVIGYPIK